MGTAIFIFEIPCFYLSVHVTGAFEAPQALSNIAYGMYPTMVTGNPQTLQI